jgi:DNA replication protein DnaC
MTDEIEQLLRNLHLKKIAAIVDDELAHADKHQLSYGAFLARLLRAQYHHRQETALAWRIKQARLPETWTIESFPFKRQPGVNPKQIRALAELEFVTKAENLIFIGQTGVGKTGLASGLLLKAIQKRLSRALHSRARSLRRNVCLPRRPLDAPGRRRLLPATASNPRGQVLGWGPGLLIICTRVTAMRQSTWSSALKV